MKTRIAQRALGLLLALAMALGTPGAALAAETPPDETRAVPEALLGGIAASYPDDSGVWAVLDMAAYAKLGLTGARTSDGARRACLDSAVAALQTAGAADTAWAQAILVASALGLDPTRLEPPDGGTTIDAVAGLNAAAQSASPWCAPYTLAAYNQGDYGDTDPYEALLIDAVLDAQAEDGSWSEWGDTIQATSHMIAGLAFYQDVNPAAAYAIGKALDYLSAAQREDGGFDAYGFGPDAATAAMVVMALAAAGVDPDADPRFVKNGSSALDGLLRFAYAGNSGFGFRSAGPGEDAAAVADATERAFRALIAAWQVMTTGAAYNVYDFRAGLPGKNAAVQATSVTAPGVTFPDVAGHQDQTAVEALARRGIITGRDDGTFDPDAGMTRAEFAAIVVRALGLEPQAADGFTDVRESDWFAPWVGAACAYGIVTGRGGGVFDPQGAITRQEAAVMVARAAALCGMDTALTDGAIASTLDRFSDGAAVGAWARPGVAFCCGAGILDVSGTALEPGAAILRCEIARMLCNLLRGAKLL